MGFHVNTKNFSISEVRKREKKKKVKNLSIISNGGFFFQTSKARSMLVSVAIGDDLGVMKIRQTDKGTAEKVD